MGRFLGSAHYRPKVRNVNGGPPGLPDGPFFAAEAEVCENAQDFPLSGAPRGHSRKKRLASRRPVRILRKFLSPRNHEKRPRILPSQEDLRQGVETAYQSGVVEMPPDASGKPLEALQALRERLLGIIASAGPLTAKKTAADVARAISKAIREVLPELPEDVRAAIGRSKDSLIGLLGVPAKKPSSAKPAGKSAKKSVRKRR